MSWLLAPIIVDLSDECILFIRPATIADSVEADTLLLFPTITAVLSPLVIVLATPAAIMDSFDTSVMLPARPPSIKEFSDVSLIEFNLPPTMVDEKTPLSSLESPPRI